jgi:hypothetical protein
LREVSLGVRQLRQVRVSKDFLDWQCQEAATCFGLQIKGDRAVLQVLRRKVVLGTRRPLVVEALSMTHATCEFSIESQP